MEYQGNQDQAGTLRELSVARKAETGAEEKAMRAARVMSVTSGKGGVGKTICVANLAMIMDRQGYRVLVIDADLGLANIDLYFGLSPQFNLNHFFSGEKALEDILVVAPEGITVLPAGSGVQKYTRLESTQKLSLMEGLD